MLPRTAQAFTYRHRLAFYGTSLETFWYIYVLFFLDASLFPKKKASFLLDTQDSLACSSVKNSFEFIFKTSRIGVTMLTGQNRSSWIETRPTATSSTTYSVSPSLGSNASRHDVHVNLLTYLLTPWCRVLLEKLTGLQLVKKFPAFHRIRRFITTITSVRHLSLSWASPIQSINRHPTSWRSILI